METDGLVVVLFSFLIPERAMKWPACYGGSLDVLLQRSRRRLDGYEDVATRGIGFKTKEYTLLR